MTREIANIDFGKWMKEKRKAKGITQETFAHDFGIGQNVVSLYETGQRMPHLDEFEDMVRYFGAEIVIRERNEREEE